ncbi:MAG: CBS domain-containing protein [Hyphomicrobiaceae bacterium]|jgi:CBS domain-containing protein
MKVGDISNAKTVTLETISPENTVHDAIKILAAHNFGALPVVGDEGRLIGIISERDILRLCANDDCGAALARAVGDVMTTNLVIGVPDDDITYVMQVMTERHIRHLPILDNGVLVGIVSIGDVVKAQYEQKETEVRFLRDYLSGATA